jgi:ubiquinone/menaquinone biosynthesis C-methylase UbiE
MSGFRDAVMLKHLPIGAKILDVGCGGGRPMLAEIGQVTGLEPNSELAESARRVYHQVVIGSADSMPFPSDSFDAVVSTDIIGHIPSELKPKIFAEMFRVLKPGGVTLHVAEAFSENWLYRIARTEPQAFQRTWIDEVDHHFVEDVETLVARFKTAGFEVRRATGVMGFIPEVGSVAALFRDHRSIPFWLKWWRAADRLLSRSDVGKELASLALTPLAGINAWARPNQGLGCVILAFK